MKGAHHTPDWNLSKWPLHEKWTETVPESLWYMHLTLPGCEGGHCLAKEEHNCLHHLLVGGMFSFREALPWLFPSTLKFSENDLSSLDEPFHLFFKKYTLISKKFPFWAHLDELRLPLCISQARRMHSVHQRRDPPVLSIPQLCLRALKAKTHHQKMHPTTILETHIRNYGFYKPTPTYIKTHLRTQETPP